MRLDALLQRVWYQPHPLARLLAPLGWLYAALVLLRRAAYRSGLLPTVHAGVPVVVVGNISAGGTGKTPVVVWLAGYLRACGWRPGIVCRGYGGSARRWPQQVRADSDPHSVGDEAVLLARRTGCPVIACGPRRLHAVRELVRHGNCDLVISDDGLQHLRLARDVEIAVIDGERRHGNGRCLPAGPLREPASRLHCVDLVIANGAAQRGEFAMALIPGPAVRLDDPRQRAALASFAGSTVHAVCGIGNPRRFFAMLQAHGLALIEHALPDHHRFSAPDVDFDDALAVFMTEKDAVKCYGFASDRHWYVPVTAQLPDAFCTRLERLLGEAPGTPAVSA